MSTWIFYSARGTCALATHIALHEAGAAFELRPLDFAAKGQQAPEFLSVNPKGRVPALVTERGILTETPALLAFVAQQFPQARLAPLDDTFAFAKLQEFNSYLCSTVHVSHAHKHRGARWADEPEAHEAMRRKVGANMTAHMTLIEAQLSGDHVLGANYSVADAYLYVVSGWLAGDGVDIAQFPRLQAHRQRVGQRPAVLRAERELQG
ncbi:glutathione S-transferase family protein [Roseateles toxinivorans]|uniref:Glutathione S-transferase n=1 Tax=Roseateles toxinivorans TaxID=270368 RepID=A0A4R6QKA7_9BURK|nr:glutathione S-transferase family protein [Roseateles toxinivorans]TDP64010.1 glutathione S-transferase [Roseateles toxinivorans]